MKFCVTVGAWIALVCFDCGTGFVNASSAEDEIIVVEDAILKTIRTISVSAQVSGALKALEIREGETVHENQELGSIRDTSVRIQCEKAKASLDIAIQKKNNDIDVRLASKNKAVAENEFQRAVQANLLVRDTYPLNEIDRLQLITDRASLELERSAFQQKMAEFEVSVSDWEHKHNLDLLDRHRVVAPCSGMVVSVEKSKGEWVEAGTVLLKLVQIDTLRIEGFLNANDAQLDRIGTHAELSFDESMGNLKSMATVVFISPDVNPLNGQVRVYLEVKNADHKLRPGLRPKTTLSRTMQKLPASPPLASPASAPRASTSPVTSSPKTP